VRPQNTSTIWRMHGIQMAADPTVKATRKADAEPCTGILSASDQPVTSTAK